VADDEGRVFAGPSTRVDLQARLREGVSPRQTDLARLEGKANLVQALILRLKTEQGELASLGHPNYGSRHHRLIGEPNTEGNRNLIRLHILECLRQEPRLEKIERIVVRPGQGRQNRDKVEIELVLIVKGVPDTLIVVVPFSFEGPLE
jgi:phage baseplate assembly protein W